jgi:hypothetical protein
MEASESRSDRPLGRGLEDISHVFLSPRRESESPPAPAPAAEAHQERPITRGTGAQAPLLLRPSAGASREQVAAALLEFEGAIEPGLVTLDAAIACPPHDDIDVLAIDRASQLTVVDFDLTVSDELLMRGLAHVDWVTDHLPNLRRMFRGQPINFSLEPRLILLAPHFTSRAVSVARLARPRVSWVRYQMVETPSRPGIFFEPLRSD